MAQQRRCPHCSSKALTRSHRRGFDFLFFRSKAFRCLTCQRRFLLRDKPACPVPASPLASTNVPASAAAPQLHAAVIPDAPLTAAPVVQFAEPQQEAPRRPVPWFLISELSGRKTPVKGH